MVAATLPDAGLKLEEHFNEVVKMSRTGQRGQRKIRDYFLSGYPGCGNRQLLLLLTLLISIAFVSIVPVV